MAYLRASGVAPAAPGPADRPRIRWRVDIASARCAPRSAGKRISCRMPARHGPAGGPTRVAARRLRGLGRWRRARCRFLVADRRRRMVPGWPTMTGPLATMPTRRVRRPIGPCTAQVARARHALRLRLAARLRHLAWVVAASSPVSATPPPPVPDCFLPAGRGRLTVAGRHAGGFVRLRPADRVGGQGCRDVPRASRRPPRPEPRAGRGGAGGTPAAPWQGRSAQLADRSAGRVVLELRLDGRSGAARVARSHRAHRVAPRREHRARCRGRPGARGWAQPASRADRGREGRPCARHRAARTGRPAWIASGCPPRAGPGPDAAWPRPAWPGSPRGCGRRLEAEHAVDADIGVGPRACG